MPFVSKKVEKVVQSIETENPVIKLCIRGTRAEFEGKVDLARTLYWQAWEASRNDYEACIAAHYVARHQENPEDNLHWNQIALFHADAAGDDRVESFYPSLFINLGRSYEKVGNQSEARRYYKLASDLGLVHHMD